MWWHNVLFLRNIFFDLLLMFFSSPHCDFCAFVLNGNIDALISSPRENSFHYQAIYNAIWNVANAIIVGGNRRNQMENCYMSKFVVRKWLAWFCGLGNELRVIFLYVLVREHYYLIMPFKFAQFMAHNYRTFFAVFIDICIPWEKQLKRLVWLLSVLSFWISQFQSEQTNGGCAS